MKLVVFGSCVTRDAIELVADEVKLQGYFARSSLGSAYAETACSNFNLNAIKSSFQRKMVEADLIKSFPNFLSSADFDYIIYDPIDERFDLVESFDGVLCTLSNELNLAGLDQFNIKKKVFSGSDEFYEMWQAGWCRLIRQLEFLGKKSRVIINKVYWANITAQGNDFAPVYNLVRVNDANAFLDRLYARMEQDLPASQFLSYDSKLIVADELHKWGKSPFHYVEGFYEAAKNFICQLDCHKKHDPWFLPVALDSVSERSIKTFHVRGVSESRFVNEANGPDTNVKWRANGQKRLLENELCASFVGQQGTYELAINAGSIIKEATGVSVSYRLHGWDNIRYLAIGYTQSGVFSHIKITGARQDNWDILSFSQGDIIAGVQRRWAEYLPPEEIGDVRIYVKGTPSASGAKISCQWFSIWQEVDEVPGWLRPAARFNKEVSRPINCKVIDAISDYVFKCNPAVDAHVAELLVYGRLPLTGGKVLDWEFDEAVPESLGEVGTYSYLWHAMHPVLTLLAYHHRTGEIGAVFAARDYVSNWLSRSFFENDPDIKFTWYDHGAAERLLALIFLHALGIHYDFDVRFMLRLRYAILKHGQLLESDAFYASHQSTRYHNHAWFQDMALIAAAQLMSNFPCAKRWFDKGVDRLTDQFDHLIVRDQGFAIFVENSIGYHQGVQRLAHFAGALVLASNSQSILPTVAKELLVWSEFLKYPDNRSPSQGDTFRRPNPKMENKRSGKVYDKPTAKILEKAGYAVVKGNHEDVPFMLCLFATSLCETHKHEDNSSITLFYDGVEWLIDPSFYSHEYKKERPAFLRSAAAHSCLVFEKRKYSISPELARIEGVVTENRAEIISEHNSYEGVKVRRALDVELNSLILNCVDSFAVTDGDVGNMYLNFSLGESVSCELGDDFILLASPLASHCLKLAFSDDVVFQIKQSYSGAGFMECNKTEAVRVKFRNRKISWCLTVVADGQGSEK